MGLSSAGQPVPVTRMSRGALRIRVTKDGTTLDLMTAHLKSKLLTFPQPGGGSRFDTHDEGLRAQVAGLAILLRAAEAVTLRSAANGLLAAPNRVPLLVLGDFNDEPDAQTSLILDGPPGSTIGTRAFEIPDHGDAARLFNLVLALPPGRNFSRMYHGVPELIDHIYASQEFFPIGPNHRRTLPQPGDVDSHVDFGETPSLPSIGDDPTARAAAIAPDHAPVTARLSL
jgi:endonuclease/exonuclease/phosphatase family metal-dependent hydrolase